VKINSPKSDIKSEKQIVPLTSILVKEYKLNKRNEKSIENIKLKSSKLYLR
jgi:hypothetical protein